MRAKFRATDRELGHAVNRLDNIEDPQTQASCREKYKKVDNWKMMKYYDSVSQYAVNLFLEPFTECASVSVMSESRGHT